MRNDIKKKFSDLCADNLVTYNVKDCTRHTEFSVKSGYVTTKAVIKYGMIFDGVYYQIYYINRKGQEVLVYERKIDYNKFGVSEVPKMFDRFYIAAVDATKISKIQ